ncbi:hypothetical protein ACJMK2_019397 [Sinanodonta woodiana]|uniref:Uncharacterized protein n=1 Tax=Sinanodonta woodiana TaxID=1069815 RepID=A0ABD3UHV1_SINWO
MEMVGRNKLETFMKETYFVQPLINIWRKSGMLPSNATDVCLCLIDDILKEKTKLPRSNATFNLVSEVDRVPKVRGKIFVISYGKVLCLLGKIALTCLQNESIKDIFHEKEMEQLTNTTAKELTEICIAAKLVSTAPVSDSSTINKRLCFQNKIMQCFLVAFHLACKGESQVKDIQSEECETIQTFLTSLTSVS